jgi:hypothetical protein
MARLAARVDDNQREICAFLRGYPGVAYAVTSPLGRGFPDLVVSYCGINDLWELKDGRKAKSAQKLTLAEFEFHERWRGPIVVIRSKTDALNRLDWLRGRGA